MSILRRITNLFHRSKLDQDIDAELHSHIEMRTADNVAAGMPLEEARRQAALRFGSQAALRERVIAADAHMFLDSLWQDLHYAFRMLRKSPGFTAVAILTLALGIGANTAIFSIVDAVLLQPLPFHSPTELVSVVSTTRGNVPDNASYPDFADWRVQNHVFSQMATYTDDDITLTGQGEAIHIHGADVSADLFSLLGVKTVLGRAFLPDEDKLPTANGTFAIILSHHLWREHFGGDPKVIGRTIQVDNRDFTVVGVMPAGVQFPIEAQPIDFWVTMALDFLPPSMTDQRGAHFLDVIARLKPQVSVAQAQTDMSLIVDHLNKQYRDIRPSGVMVLPEIDQVTGPARPALLILLAAVGCVLLIACANVANLMLARGAARQKEIAVRGALGASRGRMIRQLLTESVLLAFIGGALGATAGPWAISVLISLLPVDIPRLSSIGIDSTVLLFTALATMLTGILFGLAPAVQAARLDFVEYLKEGSRGLSESLHRSRGRSALVIADVAIAAVLLIGAGLLTNSFLHLEHVDPGFNPQHVLTFKIDLPDARYSGLRQTQFFEQAIARLNRLPGVRSASAVMPLPLDGGYAGTFLTIEGQPVTQANRPRADYSWVEPGYFQTVGIPLVAGRDFTATDDLKTVPVGIINEAFARRYFPHQNPVGKRIKPGIDNGYNTPPLREIVGVVGDVRQEGLASPPYPEIYAPLAQSPLGGMNFVVRTNVDPLTIVSAVRKEMAEVDRNVPLYGVETFGQYLHEAFAVPRFVTTLFGLFAALALALASIGLYGLVSYSATRRTHEIGVRIALGAQRIDVLRMVFGQGIKLVLIG
ncbi:MAG TPA: ABC transporter permease, partial [Candidatus Acidoferrales bacterium]|nr:ABC transporter permease [Candidatus Acidoferrales bacterium]